MIVPIASTTESCKIVRDHLTPSEVQQLIATVRKHGGWYAYRNAFLILMLYRHGLRRAEASQTNYQSYHS